MILLLLFLAICLGSSSSALADNPKSAYRKKNIEQIDFNRDIRPLFNQHCTSCHGGVKQAADISFVYRNQVVAPEGWIVEPGDPAASPLIDRVTTDDLEIRMPPPEHGRGLNPKEIRLLKNWIEQGAKWSGHWAFEQPQLPTIPSVENANWARTSIDPFILEKLETRNIKPAADESPSRWLRRASLDLTGLPPTLEQRTKFLKQLELADSPSQTEAAFSNVVDSLLDSPTFGERWASVWLDQVRYADSKGLGIDGPRNIWKYRDWVIDSFNRDMPYDQFTIKQVAGDLLPNATISDYLATAAHRLTQTNEEGGTDDEEFRIAAVLDRTNTTWQVWQGITFGCVQCHNHPYDPIEHEEYYQFAAFFNNTKDSDLGNDWPHVAVPLDPRQYDKASELDRRITKLSKQIWKTEFERVNGPDLWHSLRGLTATTSNNTQIRVDSKSSRDEFQTIGTVSNRTDITLVAPLPESFNSLSAIRINILPNDPKTALDDSEWGFVLSHLEVKLKVPGNAEPIKLEVADVIGDEPNSYFDPRESLNAKSTAGFGAFTRINYPRTAVLLLEQEIDIPKGTELVVELKHRVAALGTFPLVSKRGYVAVTDSKSVLEILAMTELEQRKLQLEELRKHRSQIKSTNTPVLKERVSHLARQQRVFIRGLFLTKGEHVSPGVPKSLPRLPNGTAANRLALANWLVSKDNPLTARVAVNRLWARVFGTGIVATEEDFGSSGEPPSHPALLDFLALKFQNEWKWSQKRVLREIVLSRAYRQSSKIRPELQEVDSANRMLARGPRNRLASEAVRDQALALSGLLSSKQFGPPVRPPIPSGVWKPFAAGDKWKTPAPGSEDRYRRAIYTYTKRSIPYPMFAAFDAPSREVCAPRRLQSNTPIQALMTLNDPTMQECIIAFGRRMMSHNGQPADKLTFGFLTATCRKPDREELATLQRLLNSYSLDDAAGWEACASVILNLDEVLTK